MRPITQRTITAVEALTGFPVHLSEDASLHVDATIRIGNTATPIHVLRYRPLQGSDPDYYIVFQCGFVTRLYQAPPEARLDLSPSEEGISKVTGMVESKHGTHDDRLRDIYLHGLGTQLRSIPVGLRIDDSIAADCPDLKDLQEQAARKQLEDNARSLAGPLKESAPAKIYDVSISMLAAVACYWSRRLDDGRVAQPYKLAGFLDKGQRLLRLFDTASPKPEDDPALVDAWAFELGIKGWYRWVPREAGTQ